jgi:hypothetical protein
MPPNSAMGRLGFLIDWVQKTKGKLIYHSMTPADDPWTFVKMLLKPWRTRGKGLWFWGFARQHRWTRHTVALLLPWSVHTHAPPPHTHTHTHKSARTAIALTINSTSWFVPPRKKQPLKVSCHTHLLSPTAWIAVKYKSNIVYSFINDFRIWHGTWDLQLSNISHNEAKMHFPHH